jgi:hypothetical protein
MGRTLGLGSSFGLSSAAATVPEHRFVNREEDGSYSWTNAQHLVEMSRRLREIEEECAEAGWDGYHALPVNHSALRYASYVIHALPSHLEVPDLNPQADGEISFAWQKGPNHHTMFTISPFGRIAYAGIMGDEEFAGTKQLVLLDELVEELRYKYQLSTL